jgi:pyruvate formate lyase activating enzyme
MSCGVHCTEPGGPPRGMLTDVLRFSLHDGPGIRTTVFFKGCPLRCAWCHNPETQSSRPELAFREEKCRRCGACQRACGITSPDAEGFSREKCQDIAKAAEVCPNGALSIAGRWWTIDEVMHEALKDAAYYDASGGGLTLSGGEPLAQMEFASALLAVAHRHGLHTCVETCGHVSTEQLLSLVADVDLFLFDWKISDSKQHQLLTGVPNDLIRVNLELAAHHAPVVLRCPLMPGVNDSVDHFDGILALARHLQHLERIELIPYHSAGMSKYPLYGRANPLPKTNPPDAEMMGMWRRRLQQAPCPVSVREA